MLSLYEKRNGWSILVTKYKNNLYISQHTKPEERNAFPNERNKMFSYYGLKFVQYCLADDPLKMPDPSQQVDARTQFFGLFKRMLVGRNFLFAAEMAGIASDTTVNLNERGQLNQLKFIGLKVCPEPPTKRRAIYNFRYRFQNVWTQSFLTGVNDVYFGIRNLNGIVRNIEHYSTDDLLRLCESDWNPSKGFSFLDDFLKLVEAETDKTDCPHTVFEFNFSEITLNITCTKHPGKTELSLLPDWYLEAFDA